MERHISLQGHSPSQSSKSKFYPQLLPAIMTSLFNRRLVMNEDLPTLSKLVIPPPPPPAVSEDEEASAKRKNIEEVPALSDYYRASPYYGKIASSYGLEVITDGLDCGVEVKHNPKGKKYGDEVFASTGRGGGGGWLVSTSWEVRLPSPETPLRLAWDAGSSCKA